MIEVEIADLHAIDVEAVLRPVGSDLAAVTGGSQELEVRAGVVLADRLRAMGETPVGGALITPGGELPISFLIHVVVQSPDEPASELGIRRGLLNGLRRAAEWGVRSMAVPPLGVGAGNLDPEVAARVMVPVIVEHLASVPRPPRVVVAVANEYEREVFLRIIAPSSGAAEGSSDPNQEFNRSR